jgi:hypothetical protein
VFEDECCKEDSSYTPDAPEEKLAKVLFGMLFVMLFVMLCKMLFGMLFEMLFGMQFERRCAISSQDVVVVLLSLLFLLLLLFPLAVLTLSLVYHYLLCFFVAHFWAYPSSSCVGVARSGWNGNGATSGHAGLFYACWYFLFIASCSTETASHSNFFRFHFCKLVHR